MMETKNKKKIRNDIIFIGALLLVLAIISGCLLLFREKGSTVKVTVDGEIYGTYPLDKDQTIEIRTENGYNILVIEDGEAYIREASCPDGVCSSHEPIPSWFSNSIICLPNKVVVELDDNDSQGQNDNSGGLDINSK